MVFQHSILSPSTVSQIDRSEDVQLDLLGDLLKNWLNDEGRGVTPGGGRKGAAGRETVKKESLCQRGGEIEPSRRLSCVAVLEKAVEAVVME